jgi:hypothetical protein
MRILGVTASGFIQTGNYELISTFIVPSNQSSVTFSNLDAYSSTYKHLQIRYVGMMDTVNRWWAWRANGDVGTNYRTHQLNIESSFSTLQSSAWTLYAHDNNTTNEPISGVIDFLDAYSSTKNKVSRSLSGTASGASRQHLALASGLWLNTSPITSLTMLLSDSGNFRTGSRFSIYGIRG